MTDEDLAAHLAQEAGRLLLEQRHSQLLQGAALGHVADKVANAFILTGLAEWRPDDAVLSEESPDDPVRLGQSRCWIIDPLDGTREYGGGAARLGGACRAGGGRGADARRGGGAGAGPAVPLGRGRRRRAPARKRPVMLVSRTRPPPEVEEIAALLGAELRPMGSAGAKAMAVVAGEADLYYHAGGQHEWDNCAPAAVALGRRAARQPARRLAARLQPGGHLHARSRHRPARICRDVLGFCRQR